MKLIEDIKRCVKRARRKGADKFSVLGATGVPEVRCNVHFNREKGYLLVLSWLDGNRPSEEDALGLVALFSGATNPGGHEGPAFVKEEYAGAPGGRTMWHRTYILPDGDA